MYNVQTVQYRGVPVLDSTREVYNLENGGSQFTMTLRCPVHGIFANSGNDNGGSPRENCSPWRAGAAPILVSEVCDLSRAWGFVHKYTNEIYS
jgi:hypothetical protein